MKCLSILTIFLICINSSCNSLANNSTFKRYRILKTEKLIDYKIVTFANDLDTIIGVAKRNVSKKCIADQISNFRNKSDYKEISFIIEKNDTIFFSYFVKSLNPSIKKAYVGSGPPGLGQLNKHYIFSYNSSPVLLRNCE